MNQARRLADDDTNRDGFATMTGAKPARVVNTRRELTELGRRAMATKTIAGTIQLPGSD